MPPARFGPINTLEGFEHCLDHVVAETKVKLRQKYPEGPKPPPSQWTELLEEWKQSFLKIFSQLKALIETSGASNIWRIVEWSLLILGKQGDLIYPHDHEHTIWFLRSKLMGQNFLSDLDKNLVRYKWINNKDNIETPINKLWVAQGDCDPRQDPKSSHSYASIDKRKISNCYVAMARNSGFV